MHPHGAPAQQSGLSQRSRVLLAPCGRLHDVGEQAKRRRFYIQRCDLLVSKQAYPSNMDGIHQDWGSHSHLLWTGQFQRGSKVLVALQHKADLSEALRVGTMQIAH